MLHLHRTLKLTDIRDKTGAVIMAMLITLVTTGKLKSVKDEVNIMLFLLMFFFFYFYERQNNRSRNR